MARVVLGASVEPELAERVRKAADRRGVTVSAFVRGVLLRSVRGVR